MTKLLAGLMGGKQPFGGLLHALIEEAAMEEDKELLNALNKLKDMPTSPGKTLLEKLKILYDTSKISYESYKKIYDELTSQNQTTNDINRDDNSGDEKGYDRPDMDTGGGDGGRVDRGPGIGGL